MFCITPRAVNILLFAAAGIFGCSDLSAQLFPVPWQIPIVANAPNGLSDVNPYGIAYVPPGIVAGKQSLVNSGDLLVSMFNNAQNVAGTGTTLTRITPQGLVSNFYTATPGHGLTNALAVLRNGIVIVGSLPTDSNGNPLQGSLIFLNRLGKGIPLTINGGTQAGAPGAGELNNINVNAGVRNGPNVNPIQGPWSLTVDDNGTGSAAIYVSMVLSGSIQRFDIMYDSDAQNIMLVDVVRIATGYTFKRDTAGLVLGPAGLFHFTKIDPASGYRHDDLYVANSADDTIYLVTDAGWTYQNATGTAIGTPVHVQETVPDPNTAGNTIKVNPLHGPLGLALAPNGNLVVANSDPAASFDPNHPSELIEFKTDGTFVSRLSLDPNNGGAFGVAFVNLGTVAAQLAFVNDNQVAMGKLTFPVQ